MHSRLYCASIQLPGWCSTRYEVRQNPNSIRLYICIQIFFTKMTSYIKVEKMMKIRQRNGKGKKR